MPFQIQLMRGDKIGLKIQNYFQCNVIETLIVKKCLVLVGNKQCKWAAK